jgi:hypothetical protein
MERCMDCNSMLAKEEIVCMECGTKVGRDKPDAADFGVTLITMLFYASIVAVVISPFMSRGPGFMFCLLISFALLFMMRTAKDGVEKVRKR